MDIFVMSIVGHGNLDWGDEHGNLDWGKYPAGVPFFLVFYVGRCMFFFLSLLRVCGGNNFFRVLCVWVEVGVGGCEGEGHPC